MPRVLIFALVFGICTATVYADDRDKALKLFEDSDKAYKAGQFERAADLLREAYTLYPEPLLLYNLGRAQEGLGDAKGAVESYDRYLQEAQQLKDRGAIERRIATLKAQIAKAEADARRRAEDDERQRREEAERRRNPAPPVDSRTSVEKYGPWITMSSGGAVVASGVFFGVRALMLHEDAIAAPIQRDSLELQQRAERSATIANVTFAVGGALVATGLVWKVWQLNSSSTTTAWLDVGPTSVTFQWAWQ